MTQPDAAAWTTSIGDAPVQIPATIDGVRQVLAEDPERLMEFERDLGRTPAAELPAFVAAYALPRQAWDEIDATIERLRAGDFSGCTPIEDLHDAPAGTSRSGLRDR